MKNSEGISKTGFIKSYVAPVLIIFLIPGFGYWFFRHVEKATDAEVRQAAITQIQASNQSKEDRDASIEIFEKIPVSRIMASNNPELRDVQSAFEPMATRYAVFRWMKRTAFLCLATGIGAFVAAGIGVLCSFRSQKAQYWSLRAGWHVLRWFAVIQVLGQGVLVVALSFWMTAFWAERYIPKLILVAVIAAVGAAAFIIRAIFRKLEEEAEFAGRLLKRDEAPALWNRISEMAARLGTTPPDNIFVGIDDNFFVTEHSVKVAGEPLSGRTLFVSLSLLRVLDRSEAEAVLAHELAHFSGDDTLFSKRISPLLGKYVHYLDALHQHVVSLPVFLFMLFFWNLYQLSLNKLRREREFRADKIGAELTSPNAMAGALVKVIAYGRYRNRIQEELFGKEENVGAMNVSERLQAGFPGFMRACIAGSELAESGTPHPFDSHPPLSKRLESLGLKPDAAIRDEARLEPVVDSWFAAAPCFGAIESEQWKAFEDNFQQAHLESLAWRYEPKGDAEIAHVQKFFPTLQFQNKKGVTATLSYEGLQVSDWEDPFLFSTALGCSLDDSAGGGKQLVMNYEDPKTEKVRALKLPASDFVLEGVEFLPAFEKYYARSQASKEYREQKKAEATANTGA